MERGEIERYFQKKIGFNFYRVETLSTSHSTDPLHHRQPLCLTAVLSFYYLAFHNSSWYNCMHLSVWEQLTNGSSLQ